MRGQSSSSFVPGVIKTNMPLNDDHPTQKEFFYCKDVENEVKSCHNKTNKVNFVWMQDFCMLLKSDSTS